MSRSINNIREIIQPLRINGSLSQPSQLATDFQSRPLASITEINSRQPIEPAGGVKSATHRMGELLGSLVDLIAEFDGTGVLLDVWTGDKSLLVRPVEEMLGQPLISIIGEDAYAPFRTRFERIHKSGIAEDFEYSLNLADGPHLFVARAIPVDGANGDRTIRVLVQDVTGLRKSEEHSRKMESLLENTQELAKVGSWEYDTAHRRFLWSEQMYRMLGLEPTNSAVELDTACKLIHPDDRARVLKDVMNLIETGKALENEVRFQAASGEELIFFSRAIPIRAETGTVRLIRGISQDVTGQRAAAAKLQKSQELLVQAEEIAHFGSWELDSHGATRMLSENLYQLIGEDPKRGLISVEEALGRIEPSDAGIVRQNLDRAASEGVAFEQEIRYRRPDARLRTFHIRCVPLLDANKNVTRMVGVAHDVTEQRDTQRALRESERHYRILLNSLKDHAVLTLNPHGYVTNWHNAAERMLGFSGKEALGMHFSRFYPDEDVSSEKPIREIDQVLREGRFEGEGWRVRKDGSRFWAEVVIAQLRDDEGQLLGFAVVTRDITERKRTEEELAKRESLLAEAESLANLGSWELDLRTGEMTWSLQLYRILGYDPAQTMPTFAEFARLIQLDLKDEMYHDSPAGPSHRYPIESVVRWELLDGSARILHTRAWPSHSSGGEPLRMIGTTEDVTERTEKETELRRLSRQLLHARDAEQRRIARDLHETAVQSMAALKMMLGRIGNMLPKSNKRASDLVRSTTEVADEIIREVRTISHLMHPPLLDEGGLYPALHWYARGFSERSGIAANLQMDEGFGRLPRDTEIAIFRIVQEALTNVHRHSGSRDAIIRVVCSDASVRVEIEDHGKGMPLLSGPAGEEDVQLGVGTAGMRERVAQLGGKFEIRSAPAKGAMVSAVFPAGAGTKTIGATTGRSE
jgi:PAS domain S-box-containing protein